MSGVAFAYLCAGVSLLSIAFLLWIMYKVGSHGQ